MNILKIQNPFDAPVFFIETVSSTMDISRQLASEGAAHGAVVTADFQEAGRGRIQGRSWEMDRGASLPFTILLRYPRLEEIPSALTLRAGLAVSLAIEDFASQSIENNELLNVKVKWPNDIMIGGKKAAGILCEANDGDVHLGIGINITQSEFPVHLRGKATSIREQLAGSSEQLAISNEQLAKNIEQLAGSGERFTKSDARFLLLEMVLARLHEELETEKGKNWKSRLEQRLFKKGEQVVFAEGAADSGKIVKGCLAGIGEGGELLITSEGEIKTRAFIAGELKFTL